MKKIFQLMTAIAFIAPVAVSATSECSSETEHQSPFACNAFALSPEVRKRHFEELGPELLKLKKSTRELPDGYQFELPADNKTYQLLTEWAFQERLCCPFFEIDLRFDRENGPLWLLSLADPGLKSSSRWSLASPNLVRTNSINGVVMLSEAKHLCLSPLVDRSRFDPRFFSRGCGIRMTL